MKNGRARKLTPTQQNEVDDTICHNEESGRARKLTPTKANGRARHT